MTEQNEEKQGDPFAKQITEDLLHILAEGQSIQDVIDNPHEPLPEWMTEEDILLLWGYLPEERRSELTPFVERITASVPDAPQSFSGWEENYRDQRPSSAEATIALLMLVSLAGENFREWFVVYTKLSDKFITLKRIAARQMFWLAKIKMQKDAAERKMKEVGLG